MTWLTASYDLAGPEIPPSADAGPNPSRESVPHRYITDPGGPDELHLTRAGTAHYDLRLAELSTRPASHGCSTRPCARATRSTEATMMFLDCPAYRDQDGAERCGLPAEVRCRFTMHSTDGPVESAMIRCPAGHYFCGPIESLTWDGKNTHDPRTAAATSRAGRDGVPGSHDGHDGTDGPAVRHSPETERRHPRPNTAPAYYLGRPAALWITVMRPHHRSEGRARNPREAIDGSWWLYYCLPGWFISRFLPMPGEEWVRLSIGFRPRRLSARRRRDGGAACPGSGCGLARCCRPGCPAWR